MTYALDTNIIILYLRNDFNITRHYNEAVISGSNNEKDFKNIDNLDIENWFDKK